MKPLKNFYKDLLIFGADTETPNYQIRLLSISDGVTSVVFDVTAKNILDVFVEYFRKISFREAVVFFHNLHFDIAVILNQALEYFLQREIHLGYGDVEITFFNDKPYFGQILYKSEKKILHIRDTFSFFDPIKLSTLAEILKIGHKLKVDNDDYYTNIITNDFREYAKIDAELTAKIGEQIITFHAIDDIPLCVSSPQMAMQIFRKNFIFRGNQLENVPFKLVRPFEFSYHGGKNGCYVETPVEIKGVNLYDISSAYPFAMTEIPSFIKAKFKYTEYKGRTKFVTGFPGIYLVTLQSHCPYNSTFAHDFTPLKHLDRVWITSYELLSLIDHGCIEELKIHASILISSDDTYKPLGDFARHYYEQKQKEDHDSPMYLHIKRTLNSLYGKFIERRYDDEKEYSIRGPNYNPAIASLITGHTRAYMHRLEHQSNAIHSATDSVFTTRNISVSKGLGGLSSQGIGKLRLFRTKLYIFYDKKGKKIKSALHGFHGSIEQLENLWTHRKVDYTYMKMPTPGEFLLHKKLHLKMYGMNQMVAKLNIDWDGTNERTKAMLQLRKNL